MTRHLEILAVDDDPDIRVIATTALRLDPAITVRAVASGAEALAMLQRERWRPDAVLLDVMMPGMDGPAVLAEIHAMGGYADLPVIFMTAKARAVDLAAYRKLGAHGVIVKPFDPLNLAEDVRALIEEPPRRR